MVSDVAAEKHGQWFDILDAGCHGYLRRDDFQAISARLARHAGATEAPALTEAYLLLWQCLDTELRVGPHGKMTRQQFVEGLDTLVKSANAGFERAVARIPSAVAALFDADADGRLTRDELLAMLAALGLSGDKADIALLALDHDADGYIDCEDLMAATREFILSEDPFAPGNWLLGGLTPKPIRYF